MLTTKKLVSFFLVLVVLFFCFSVKIEAADSKNIVIRMASAAHETMPATRAAQKFIDLVDEKSGGRIKINFFPSRQLGEDPEILEQLMNGTIEAASLVTTTFSPYSPLLEPLQLPFLLNNYEKLFKAATSKEMQGIFKDMEKIKIKILSLSEHGLRHLANNVRPILSVKDLNGLKLRVPPSDLLITSINMLGANPTPMEYGQIYTGLQNKVIDGLEINKTSIFSEKLFEVLRYFSEVGLWPFPAAIVLNLEFFEGLSPEDQKIFQDAANESLVFNMAILEQSEKNAMEVIEKSGMEISHISNIQPFREVTVEIYETYKSKHPLIKEFVLMAENL